MKEHYQNQIILFLLCMTILSCASTKTTSYSDPEFKGKSYSFICVYVESNDHDLKAKLENKVAEEIKNVGIKSIIGTELFPPTRDWNDEQIQKILFDQKADSYLKIKITDKGINEQIKSEVVTNTKNGYNKTQEKSKTFYASFKTDLIDVNSNKVAWTATSNSEINGEFFGSSFDPIISSIASDLVKELKEKGHIIIKK